MSRLRAVCIVLFSVCALSLYAEWAPLVSHFTPDGYGGGTQNWALMQQANGWMYAANNYGMLEYDGSTWSLYGLSNSTVVRSLATDTAGHLYVGGTDEFGYFAPNGFGQQEYHSLVYSIPERYRRFGEVWKISWSPKCLYVQTRNYLFLCYADGPTEVIDPGDVIRTSLLAGETFFIATLRDVYVLSANHLHPLRGSEVLRGAEVCALSLYSETEILIATDFKGLYLYDGNAVRPFYTEADQYIRSNQLYTVAIGDRHIALGTVRSGIALMDLEGHGLSYLTRENGLQNNTVLSLLFDRHGNLWAGLDKGIDCIRLASPLLRLDNTVSDYGAGYCCCEFEGALYLGTNQGLYRYSDNRLTLIEGSSGQVWDVTEVDGSLLCSHNRGLFEVRGNRLYPIESGDGVWSVRPLPVEEGDRKTAVAGTYAGFMLLTHGASGWELRHLAGFTETTLYYQVDAIGNIWLMSSRGVERLTVDRERYTVDHEVVIAHPSAQLVYSISRLDNRLVILGDNYLAVVDEQGLLHEAEPEELDLTQRCRYIFVRYDAAHNLWYGTPNKLIVRTYDAATKTYAEPREIMNYARFMIGGFSNICFMHDGTAVLGGVSGFYRVKWSEQSSLRQAALPELYVRRVTTSSPERRTLYGESYPMKQAALRLPSDVYSLRVEYSSGDAAEETMQYQTRLYPVEKEFTPFSLTPNRDLTALQPGTYRLDIRMEAAGGGVVERSLEIMVAQPWWRTWWMITIDCLSLLLLVCYIIYMVHRRMEQQRRLMEAEKDKQLHEQQLHILQLENEKTQFDLRQKSQELSGLILSENHRREFVESVLRDIRRVLLLLNENEAEEAKRRIVLLQQRLSSNTESIVDWKRFEDNFDIVNDQFIHRLKARYPWMTKQERRMCVYIKMGLQTKEIAPLLNLSPRGVEMLRYRMRSKLELEQSDNLKQFLESV
ncbi:MAG: two-component regulator propeller domain-containing protein [Paludibacteraceae bacterium]